MRNARRLALYYGVGLANILSTLLPVWPMRYELLAHRLSLHLMLGAQDVALLAGVTMLLVAYPAAQGHRRSAQVLMWCAALAVLANLLKGLDVEEALLNGALLWAVWRTRHTLHSRPLRYTVVDFARLAVLLVALTYAYNLLGKALLMGMRLLVERGEGAMPGVHRWVHVMTAKLPLEHRWFEQSRLVLPIFLVTVFLTLSWRSLANACAQHPDDDNLYERFGRASHNSLAYLAHRSDVSTFLDPQGRGAITYRQVGRVALQIGAILAPPGEREVVYQSFRKFCRAQGLLPAAVALAPEERPIAQRCGMHTIAIGTEAVVDLTTFSVERLSKKMRWAQRSLAKRGYTTAVRSAAEIPPQLRVALDRIDAEWRQARGGQAHGFCMTLGRFPAPSDPDCLISIAHDAAGLPVAYLTLLPGGEGYYSLDLTRRSHAAPNAIMEFLLLEVLGALKERGATAVSLNFSTFSSLSTYRFGKALLAVFGKAFQLGSLEAFNAKFKPGWLPRYLAFTSWYTLPDVIYAILAVEGVDRMMLNAVTRATRQSAHAAAETRLIGPRIHGEGAYR